MKALIWHDEQLGRQVRRNRNPPPNIADKAAELRLPRWWKMGRRRRTTPRWEAYLDGGKGNRPVEDLQKMIRKGAMGFQVSCR